MPHSQVFVNGNWVGIHSEPEDLVEKLRSFRREGNISHEISVIRDIKEKELRLQTDAGRVCRPLFVVEYESQRYGRRDSVVWLCVWEWRAYGCA